MNSFIGNIISKSKIIVLILIAVLGCMFILACTPELKSELYGIYVANYKIAKEIITLKEDGTFIQEVIIKATSKVTITKGAWSYDPTKGYVTFHGNFMVVLKDFGKLNADYDHPVPGLVIEPVKRYFGNIQIGSSEGILYEKKK